MSAQGRKGGRFFVFVKRGGELLQETLLLGNFYQLSYYINSNELGLKYASLVAQMVKNLPAMWETWVCFLGWEDSPGGGHGNPLQYSYLENPRGQRSLEGYSPWGHKELNMAQ